MTELAGEPIRPLFLRALRVITEDIFLETDVYMLKQRPYRACRASHVEELWELAYLSPQDLLVNGNDNERITHSPKRTA